MPAKKDRPNWDAPPRKPRSDAKLKNLPEADQETLWLLLHPTDETTPPYSLEALAVHISEEHRFEPALSSISEWRSWYSQQRRTANAMARAEQAKIEWLKENPAATPEDLERLGQMVFTSESIESGNVKAFVALMRESSRRKALELDQRKLALLERKAAAADAAKVEIAKLRDPSAGLSTSERQAIIDKVDEILGLKS
jgi:F0F1-type ATP synthase delta subunit